MTYWQHLTKSKFYCYTSKSMIANDLVIEDNNPDTKGVFRPGPIDLPRDPRVSFFSFLYKGLLEGLKPSVGFDKKNRK
jgi:hypothetical protein